MKTVEAEAIPHRPEADSFQFSASLGHLKQAVQARWWVVVMTVVCTTSLVVAYMAVWPQTFQVDVMVAADSDKDVQRNAFYNNWNVFRREGLADEAALMLSAPVLKETVRRLDLKYEDVYHPFSSYVTHLWGESWIGQNYRKVKYYFFPRKIGPFDPKPEDIEAYKVLADFRESVRVEGVKDTSIGLLTVKASTGRVAEIANTVVDVYLEQRRDRQMQEAKQALLSLSEEVDRVQAQLAAADKDVSKYRSDNNILLNFEKDKVQITQFQVQRLAVAELEAQIAEREMSLASINQSLVAEGKAIDSTRVFKDTAAQERLSKLEAQLAQARQLFQPTAPEVREVEEQIRISMADIEGKGGSVLVRNPMRVGEHYELLRAKKIAVETQLAGDRAALRKKKEEVDRIRPILDQIPEKMKGTREYERQQSLLEGKLQALNEKLAIATVSLATARSAPAAMRVVEYAVPPDKPIWPRTNLLLIAAVLSGLMLGVMAALLLELAFVRVSRYRLWEKDAKYRLFAVVDNDERFLASLYSRQARLKHPVQAARS